MARATISRKVLEHKISLSGAVKNPGGSAVTDGRLAALATEFEAGLEAMGFDVEEITLDVNSKGK